MLSIYGMGHLPIPGALLITPTGAFAEVDVPANRAHRLPFLYAALRCSTVDVVRLTRGIDMWIADEASNPLVVNHPASRLAIGFNHPRMIAGNALVTGVTNDGETRNLTEREFTRLLAKLERLAG
ncbi:DUF3846 domain-containing protein [Streptomyces calidiresistens]|uniref:DUF3846 domain-containing protein n=1 Tax=Streptomyces calidiresistens TaxID=1485586 RepID=A0A7W3T230_9ACTN|nr:DUF3846 domain-containing protein [Streptomyces calidiresistens]MBB0229499.1 DUF3846 domain-containing protein [Streptomyces calidiresistens]